MTLVEGGQYTFIVAHDRGPNPPIATKELFVRIIDGQAHVFRLDEIHGSKDGTTVALLTTYQGIMPLMQ